MAWTVLSGVPARSFSTSSSWAPHIREHWVWQTVNNPTLQPSDDGSLGILLFDPNTTNLGIASEWHYNEQKISKPNDTCNQATDSFCTSLILTAHVLDFLYQTGLLILSLFSRRPSSAAAGLLSADSSVESAAAGLFIGLLGDPASTWFTSCFAFAFLFGFALDFPFAAGCFFWGGSWHGAASCGFWIIVRFQKTRYSCQ